MHWDKYLFIACFLTFVEIVDMNSESNSRSHFVAEDIFELVQVPTQVEILLVAKRPRENHYFYSDVLGPHISQGIARFPDVDLSRLTEFNTGQLVVIFLCGNRTEFEIAVSNVLDFLQSNYRERYWKPIFILQHPETMLNESHFINSVRLDPMIQPLIENGIVSTPVYIWKTNFKARIKSVALVEVYSIRTHQIVQEISLNENPTENFDRIGFITARRSNFRKALVIAVAIDDPEYPLATKFKPNTTELISGFEVQVFQYFRDALNFTEMAIRGTDYVLQGPNGTMLGYVHQVNAGLGDVGIGAAEFLEYRVKGPDAFTYIHPMFYARIRAFFKQPPASSIRNIFIQTFTTELWLASVLIWILILSILKSVIRLKRFLQEYHVNDERIEEEFGIWAFGAICQQGWYTRPYSTSIKIIFYFGIFNGLISFIAYSAALVSILSVEVVPIREFGDLIKEKFYITSDNQIPTAKVVVQDLEDSNKIPKLADGIRDVKMTQNFDKLLKTRMAIVTIPDSFYPAIQQNHTHDFICSTISVKTVSLRPVKSSCFVRRGSPLREYFNYKLLMMQERGIKERLIKHYVLGTSVQCTKSSGKSFQLQQLGLRDVFTAFLIISFGFILSMFIMSLEKIVFLRFLKRFQVNEAK